MERVLDVGSDIAGPQWVFGQSRYAVLPDGRVALAYGRDGRDRLAVLHPGDEPRELDLPYAVFRYVTAAESLLMIHWQQRSTAVWFILSY